MDLEQLKFPIGRFQKPDDYNDQMIQDWISDIRTFPHSLEVLVKGLNASALNWPYRPGGWTVKQVTHHCADSHINSLTRFKLALTEDHPTIRPYHEERWAELPDSLDEDLSNTLMLLKGLHARWVSLLERLGPKELQRTFLHPSSGETFDLGQTIANYAWHCNHHLAHVQQALRYKGVFDLEN